MRANRVLQVPPYPCAYLYTPRHGLRQLHTPQYPPPPLFRISLNPATHRSIVLELHTIYRQLWCRPCPSTSTHSTHDIHGAAHSRKPCSLAPLQRPTLNGHADVGGAFQRKTSIDFHTPEGTVHVSKPYRSRQTKKLRAMVTFTPRKSHFDTTNERSGTNEFRVRPISIRL